MYDLTGRPTWTRQGKTWLLRLSMGELEILIMSNKLKYLPKIPNFSSMKRYIIFGLFFLIYFCVIILWFRDYIVLTMEVLKIFLGKFSCSSVRNSEFICTHNGRPGTSITAIAWDEGKKLCERTRYQLFLYIL